MLFVKTMISYFLGWDENGIRSNILVTNMKSQTNTFTCSPTFRVLKTTWTDRFWRKLRMIIFRMTLRPVLNEWPPNHSIFLVEYLHVDSLQNKLIVCNIPSSMSSCRQSWTNKDANPLNFGYDVIYRNHHGEHLPSTIHELEPYQELPIVPSQTKYLELRMV